MAHHSRRDFLKAGFAATLLGGIGGVPGSAQTRTASDSPWAGARGQLTSQFRRRFRKRPIDGRPADQGTTIARMAHSIHIVFARVE